MHSRPRQPGAPRTRDYARGDADGALRVAPVVSDLRYAIARNNHNPMELPSTIASWDGGRLTVWDKVQGISSAQHAFAEALGVRRSRQGDLAVRRRRVRQRRLTWPHQLLAAFAARQMRRPVKLVLTRKQCTTASATGRPAGSALPSAPTAPDDHRDDSRGSHRNRPIPAL